ncbi:HotDog domain-containing protein [Mycena floridula]|nr:HotDog domain-containing protein [Mycena floridula]
MDDPPITSGSALTPEQVKQFEINRLKAKAAQRQRELEASSYSSVPNANNKRPIGVTPATSTSPTAPKRKDRPLQRDSRLGNYFEYDLSKMVNSKGGFLVQDGKDLDEETIRKERERERQRAQQSMEPPIFLDPERNPKCFECKTVDIDHTYRKIFGCLVCKRCQNEKPEKYSLLTKTECKEDYLLTDPELRDHELLPHLLKANPHKSTFANMMLFLRYQVEEFAWKKWGSPEALDTEYERRVAEKKKKKNKKFEQGLKELRKRTKEGVWQKRKDDEHRHIFGPSVLHDGIARQLCAECGFALEFEEILISTALDVEKLETHLFRSKALWVPVRARGVFGGQVISQALVSATNCVDPQFGLHATCLEALADALQCYFLSSASPATPVVYYVEKLRQGKSYVSCSVKAVQNGAIIFILMCSFQKPEPWQPSCQWKMPIVPSPEDCELEEDVYRRTIQQAEHPEVKRYLEEYIEERIRSPIAVKVAKLHHVTKEGTERFMYWMKARNIIAYDAPFQKCILSYLSDLYLKGPKAVGMTSTIDHAIWFYNDTFDCSNWLLYEMECSRAGSGRGIVHGRLYTVDGTLVAVTQQEGVVRANVYGPSASQPIAKL